MDLRQGVKEKAEGNFFWEYRRIIEAVITVAIAVIIVVRYGYIFPMLLKGYSQSEGLTVQTMHSAIASMAVILLIPASIIIGFIRKMKCPVIIYGLLGICLLCMVVIASVYAPIYLTGNQVVIMVIAYFVVALIIPNWMLSIPRIYLSLYSLIGIFVAVIAGVLKTGDKISIVRWISGKDSIETIINFGRDQILSLGLGNNWNITIAALMAFAFVIGVWTLIESGLQFGLYSFRAYLQEKRQSKKQEKRDKIREIIFATSNEGKLKEAREILGELNITILSMEEAGIQVDIDEDGETFEKNAVIKAKTVSELTGKMVLADDSGLEIDYLDGEPGVHSARFMGEDTSYDVKNAVILERLQGIPKEERTARFICVIAAVYPNGKVVTTKGTMEGYISEEIKGENGFGYDPIFYVPQYYCSSAELTVEQKNEISHRGKALRAMREKLM